MDPRWTAVGLATALGGCLWQGPATDPSGIDSRLTVLYTSDLHGRLFPLDRGPRPDDPTLGLHPANGPYGGLARLGYLVRRERARAGRVLYLDGGDASSSATREPAMTFLSMMGAAASVVGERELATGVEELAADVDELAAAFGRFAAYELLAANYAVDTAAASGRADASGAAVAPFAVFVLDGIEVAVIGLGNVGALAAAGASGGEVLVAEPNETLRSYVHLLHGSVDLVIVLSHLGRAGDEALIRGYETATRRDRLVAGWDVIGDLGDGSVRAHVPGVRHIDLIFGGHDHHALLQILTDPDGREVPLVHAGAFGEALGRLDAVLREDPEQGGMRVVSHAYQIFPVDARLQPYEDQPVAEMLRPFAADLVAELGPVIGYAPETLRRTSPRGNGDSALGNLVAEAARSNPRIRTDLALVPRAALDADLWAGPVTVARVLDVLPYDAGVVSMQLSATDIQTLADDLTEAAAARGCDPEVDVAGLAFTLGCGNAGDAGSAPDDPQDEAAHLAVDVRLGDAPLAAGGSYRLALGDPLAVGVGLGVLRGASTWRDAEVSLRAAFIEHLGTLPRCGAFEIGGPIPGEAGPMLEVRRDLGGPRYCLRDDFTSQRICADIVACDAYIAACEAGCSTEDPTGMPTDNVAVPLSCGGRGTVAARGTCNPSRDATGAEIPPRQRDCFGDPRVRGPYADLPCVVAFEDGRLERRLWPAPDVTGVGQEPESP